MSKYSFGMGGGLFAGSPYSSKEPKVEFYEDQQNPNAKWRWRLWFSSDIVAASSQGYSTREVARDNFLKIEQHIKFLRENGKV